MAKENKKTTAKTANPKRFDIYLYIELISAILFSILSVSFHFDLSILAFIVAGAFTAICVYVCYFKVLRKTDSTHITAVLKLTQYLPFVLLLAFILRRAGANGTSYIYDLITVLVWCVNFIFSLVLSSCMNPKKLPAITANWNVVYKKKNKLHGSKRVLFEIVDWIDALVQAVFMVLLIQIFILQLYVIPSESMVPMFLVKDRVAVSKINCGPKFPLTDVGLDDFTKYKRGNIVVVRNPHYKMDRKSEMKTVISQLVYMLTFTTVNLNTDENGNPKYDPLVKRVCGVPGEQLVMQDGVLYRRTKDSDIFTPVTEDAKFANWNMAGVQKSLFNKIERFPLSMVGFTENRTNINAVAASQNEQYERMLDFEEYRRNYDLNTAEYRAKEIVRNIRSLMFTDSLSGEFKVPSNDEFDLFTGYTQTASQLLTTEKGIAWFESFMTSWINNKNKSMDIYSESNFKLNVMTKLTFGELVLRTAQLMRNTGSSNGLASDPVIIEYLNKATDLDWYIRCLLDERNMPVFPANDEMDNPVYIPNNCYFMMGDNRFNSLDFRHAANEFETELSKYDAQSVKYLSQMEPHYVDKKLIIGKPVYRFWPATRRTAIK